MEDVMVPIIAKKHKAFELRCDLNLRSLPSGGRGRKIQRGRPAWATQNKRPSQKPK